MNSADKGTYWMPVYVVKHDALENNREITREEMRVVDADDFDKVKFENTKLREALEHLLKAEPMQQGERNGYIMGVISQAIDKAKAALK
jgi:hypothetical protein